MKTLLTLISTTLIALILSSASGQGLYWDPGQTLSNDSGGSGNWDTNDIFWFNGAIDVPWTNAIESDAYFTGAGGTVTLTEDISAQDIYFTNTTPGSTANYVIANATGAETLTVINAIDTGGSDQTIGALLANSGTLNKNGDGVLYLPGDNAGIAGNVDINQGAICMETNGSLGDNYDASITVAPGAALEFNGGTNVIAPLLNSLTVGGTGITNSGAMRNLSGGSDTEVNIGLTGDTLFDSDNGRLALGGGGDTISANTTSGNCNITAQGLGNIYIGDDSVNIGTGTVTVETNATLYMYVGSSSANKSSTFSSVLVESNAVYYVDNDNGFGTVPSALNKTNLVLDGGTLVNYGANTIGATRGITVTDNGGAITNQSGTWTTCDVFSTNTPVTFGGSGNIRPGGSGGTVNLGTGALIKIGPDDVNTTYASTFVFSNLVLNGGSITFNYDDSSGQKSSLGSVPSAFCPSNIVLNGGALHAGHSTTINAVRGIFVGPSGGTVADVVSSGGTVTIDSVISGPGSMNFPSGLSGSHVTGIVLAGVNTYAGSTTIGDSNTVTVTGTLGTGDTVDNWSLVFNRSGTYTYGGAISGSGTVTKAGSGTVVFTGNNTYTNTTTVSGGALLIDGTNGTGAISVTSGGLLGGTGVIGGPTTVAGRLDLLSSTLSFSNNLTMSGAVTVTVNKSLTPSSGMVIVSGGSIANTGTGTLTVTTTGPALAQGDTFQIFNQPVVGGGSMKISGGGQGVAWNNNLAVDGSISVKSITPPTPAINSVKLIDGNFVFSGTNGLDGAPYYLLSSTNLALPVSQWTSLVTNTFTSNGQFSITNPITPGTPQQFYLLEVPGQ